MDPDQPPSRDTPKAQIGQLGLHTEGSRSPARLSPNRAIPHPIESKFSYVNLLRRQERSRRHSFQVPDLPSIPSNSSEESDNASESRSVSPSPKKRATKSAKFRQNNSTRHTLQEGGDSGEFSEYLLSLAARSAEEQLKDQTLAAFPNEQVYQHFDHFAIDDEAPSRNSEEENWIYPPKHHLKSRRQSSADLTWELEHLRHHKEEAEQRSRVMNRRRKPDLKLSSPKRLGPIPPMLGGDIILPQSLSPIGSFTNKNGTQSESNPCTDCGALWCGPSRPDNGRGSGLWMGTCQKDEENNNRGSQIMTGIKTPMLRDDRPPSLSPSPSRSPSHTHTHSSSPDAHAHARAARREEQGHPARSIPRSIPGTSQGLGLNLNLSTVSSIEDEFNDEFVTQIYNYLSLGYPCVARDYDHELSKISGILVEDMRKDDLHTDAKGYVMAPENELAVACTRWKALRLYIQEWARQQPNMAEEKKWGVGVPERRGSWAF